MLVAQLSALLGLLVSAASAAFQGPFHFDQLTTHDTHAALPPGLNSTFRQRYWVDTARSYANGPVLFVDAADKPGEAAVYAAEHGIVEHLADAVSATIIVLEQRYYGQSYVAPNLTVANLQLLNTEEALEDIAYFAAHFPYKAHPGLTSSIRPDKTPWIAYGSWVAGSKAAFLRARYPDTIWGAIASSAPLLAVENVWQYLEAIRLRADPLCVQVITTVVGEVDAEIAQAGLDDDGEIVLTSKLEYYRDLFNLTRERTVRDFMNQVATPLGLWQRRSWNPALEDHAAWEGFCRNLTRGIALEDPGRTGRGGLEYQYLDPRQELQFRTQSMSNYAYYIRHYLAVGHQRDPSQTRMDMNAFDQHDQVSIMGEIRRNRTESQKTDLGQVWRLWYWQACTEWGYFSTAEPAPLPAMLSRSLNLYYLTEVCRFAFNFPDDYRVPVERINQYGNVTLEAPRLLFVNGELDPWLDITAHSPLAGDLRERNGDGVLLRNHGYGSDKSALRQLEEEPVDVRLAHQEEIETVKSWIAAWKEGSDELEEL
ncbi:peptidase S28 [Apiospora sp. TS-2023a]